MPFELKKAEASYQRIINRVFREEIWVKIEVYMNDMIVNSSNEGLHNQHLDKCIQESLTV